MASIAEIRQKYPQYSDLSDEQLAGALHKKFYSDMPYDQFATKIGLVTAPAAQPPAEKPKNEAFNYTFLPIAVDEKGGISPGVPGFVSGLIESAKEAYSAPYRAYTGELPMTDEMGRTSQQAIDEAGNMALWANPTSVATGTGKQIARNAAAVRPPSEGAQVAQAARDIGVTLPRAITSDMASVQQMGKVVANIPIAGQPLRKASKTAIEQLDDVAKRTQDELGSGDRVLAGDRVRTGLHDYSKAMDGKIKGMEDALSATMNPDKLSPLPNTRRITAEIQKERFENANKSRSRAVAEVEEALSRDGMTFEGLRGLRTKIRNLRDVNPDALTTNDFEKAELARLYGALTDDLKLAAQNSGGKTALDEFNKVVSAEAKIAMDREALERVLGRNMSDEALSDKLFRMAGDKSTANMADLAKVRQAVSDETWDELASSVVSRMGRAPEGNFTPERFSTEWGKLSQGGKSLLFKGETRKALDNIAAVSSRFKKLNEYANPSGSGMTVAGSSYFAGAYLDPVSTLSALVGANITARMLAKPSSAKAVADYAKAYELAARAPGQSSQNLLAAKSRALALLAANGNEVGASNLAAKLATVQQTAATDQSEEQIGGPVGNPEPDKASQDFNDAYLQGRAF